MAEVVLSALEQGFRIVGVEYVPSAEHLTADTVSRLRGVEGWALCPTAFAHVIEGLGARGLPRPDMEAFVRGRALLPRYCARWADPGATCFAFSSQSFHGDTLWVDPLPRILGAVLGHLKAVGARGYIVAPLAARSRVLRGGVEPAIIMEIPPDGLFWEGSSAERPSAPPRLCVFAFNLRAYLG